MLTKLRSHLTYANVMATIAVFIALGGTSIAAVSLKKNSVGSTQLKKGAVKNSDLARNAVASTKVKDRSLLAKDFKPGQLPAGARGATGARGLQGTTGPAGLQGLQGLQGPAGVTGIHAVFNTLTAFNSTSPKTETVTCPVGEKVIAPSGLAEGSVAPGPINGVSLTSISVDTALTTVTVSASEDAAGIATSWFITPGAICGKF